MCPAISFSGQVKRGSFWKLILEGEKTLTTRYPRKRGQIQAGDIAKLYWKQRTPVKDKPIHLIGEAFILYVYHAHNLLNAYLRVPNYVKGEGFDSPEELFDYWGMNTVTASKTGPLDVIKFRLMKEK